MSVSLVGAGPGDPGLLTQRGAALLLRADVVVYDRLVDRSLLSLAPPGAQLIDVGKALGAGADGSARQEEINRILVEYGRNQRVVRLKGGDPFVFGRGGEEVHALVAAGVAVEVVPGVTSALGVPAMAGIPVTQRGVSAAVAIVTGRVGEPEGTGVDWESLARFDGTIVVLMGIEARAEIARRLRAGGLDADTPVALIERGTTREERIVRCTLEGLAQVVVGSPAVIVIGAVAGWPDTPRFTGSLSGIRVVITRTNEQGATLAQAFIARGAAVISLPLIEISDPLDLDALDAARSQVAKFEWVAFTSVNAVRRFLDPMSDLRALGSVRIAAVGPTTARALAEFRLQADLVADVPRAQGLGEAFESVEGKGSVLFPRSDRASDELGNALRAKGWEVEEVVAYRTLTAGAPPFPVVLEVASADTIVFASPSAARASRAVRDPQGNELALPKVCVCIGPVSAQAARDLGFPTVVQSDSPDPESLVDALESYVRKHPELGSSGQKTDPK
jgi:uroporphyrinogen III methyltransferase/synthase